MVTALGETDLLQKKGMVLVQTQSGRGSAAATGCFRSIVASEGLNVDLCWSSCSLSSTPSLHPIAPAHSHLCKSPTLPTESILTEPNSPQLTAYTHIMPSNISSFRPAGADGMILRDIKNSSSAF
jgi:hypothetical protein